MPVYYLHLRTRQGGLRPDRSGSRLTDDAHASRVARDVASEIARGTSGESGARAIEIHDEAGWHVETVLVRRLRG